MNDVSYDTLNTVFKWLIKKKEKKIEQELNQLSPNGHLFLGSLFCHLPPSAGVPHPARWGQHTAETQLMTHPSYQLITGEDSQLVPMSLSSFLFAPCHFFILLNITVSLSLRLSMPIHHHQFLDPVGFSQLTYSRCKCAKQRYEHQQWLASTMCKRGKQSACVSVALGGRMSELSSLALISAKSICWKWNCSSKNLWNVMPQKYWFQEQKMWEITGIFHHQHKQQSCIS